MNLGQIELAVYDRLNYNSTPDSAVTRRVRHYINDTHRKILGKKGYEILRSRTLPMTSVASSPLAVLPQAATAIRLIMDRANQRPLNPISLADVRAMDPGQSFTGSIPDSYCVLNYSSPIALDPSAAASLFIISDSAMDGSGTSVSIEGITSNGDYRRASTALNGLTAVNINSLITTWTTILKFYLSASAAGNVTLHQTSGVGTELARITPGRSSARYTQIYLAGIPAASQTYYCDVEVHVADMVNVNDEPLIPEDYHWLFETGALKQDYLRREKSDLWKIEQATWLDGMESLGAHIRRRGGVSKGGQRRNSTVRPSSFNSPYFNG